MIEELGNVDRVDQIEGFAEGIRGPAEIRAGAIN